MRPAISAPETGAPGTALETAAQAQEQEQSTGIVTDLDGPGNRYRSLQTRAARAGFQLHELASGELLLTRWGLAKTMPSTYAVSRFLDQITGVR